MKRKWPCLLAITGLYLLALSGPGAAQKKSAGTDSEEEKAAIRQERMQRLILAQELAAEGRKKEAPELLIAASGMLKLLADIPAMNNPTRSEVQPEIKGDGDADLDKEVPSLTLKEQSDQLFKDASDMAAGQGVNVDKLIDLVKKREENEKRALVGGPKQVCRKIGGGQTHSFTFRMFTNAPLPWSYQSSIPLRVSIVRDDDFNSYFQGVTMHAARTFHPGYSPKKKVAPITIRITNTTRQPARYQFVLQ